MPHEAEKASWTFSPEHRLIKASLATFSTGGDNFDELSFTQQPKAPEDWRTPKAGAKRDSPCERDSVLDCGSPLPLFIRVTTSPIKQRKNSALLPN